MLSRQIIENKDVERVVGYPCQFLGKEKNRRVNDLMFARKQRKGSHRIPHGEPASAKTVDVLFGVGKLLLTQNARKAMHVFLESGDGKRW